MGNTPNPWNLEQCENQKPGEMQPVVKCKGSAKDCKYQGSQTWILTASIIDIFK